MSKERELIEALRQSIDDSSATAEAARQAAGAPAGGGAGAGTASGPDIDALLKLAEDIAASMINDPVFYFKVAGLLVMTVLILVAAYYLIAGG